MQTGGSPDYNFSTGKRPWQGRSCSFRGILPEKKPAKSPALVFLPWLAGELDWATCGANIPLWERDSMLPAAQPK
jgi:hypothetical protein